MGKPGGLQVGSPAILDPEKAAHSAEERVPTKFRRLERNAPSRACTRL